MLKKILSVSGVIVFLVGIGFGVYLLLSNQRANLLDAHSFYEPLPDFSPCLGALEEVAVSRRTMSDNESQAITAVLSNPDSEECEDSIMINAPNFEISPPEATRNISVPPGEKTAQAVWILTPKKQGTFEVAIEDEAESQVVGITVTNILGLTALQAEFLSYIGSLLGPMLTVPWWYEKWKQREDKQKPKKSSTKRR